MSAHKTLLFSLAGLTLLTGCNPAATTPDSHGQKVSAYTTAANQQLQQQLPLADQQDFNDARRGLIASQQPLRVSAERNPDQSVWDMTQYAFIQGEAPDSVNPSLWRQAKLNNIHGLFEVTPGIYQLRGFDLANMTLIKGDSGWIVIDPLTSRETAANAFRFAMQQLQPRYPQLTGISAVLFTHPHLDHFGGALGIISQQEIDQRHIPVIAPQGFMEEATSENIIAGNAMSRRAMFMYGKNLPRDIWGHVGSGLGKSPAFGEFSILQPNQLVDHTLQEMTIDGVDFRFQYTPESEAPAEFTFYLPQYRAFCGAEVMSRHMHNLYTPRGAKVRDAMKWSAYIEEARRLFADADIYFGSHHWPIWGQENIQTFLKQQRDTYKFIHDQTVRRMNQGMTAGEIAEDLKMPA
ncbi:alkyl/aryl-sulfatase, partial [Thalassolituus sp. UBA1505]